jgi:hypothetical protein
MSVNCSSWHYKKIESFIHWSVGSLCSRKAPCMALRGHSWAGNLPGSGSAAPWSMTNLVNSRSRGLKTQVQALPPRAGYSCFTGLLSRTCHCLPSPRSGDLCLGLCCRQFWTHFWLTSDSVVEVFEFLKQGHLPPRLQFCPALSSLAWASPQGHSISAQKLCSLTQAPTMSAGSPKHGTGKNTLISDCNQNLCQGLHN